MKKTKVQMNKPIYLGTSILDISKILMHEIWYGYIKAKFGGRAKLCYIDTDSLIHLIMTENFMKILPMILKYGLIHLTLMKMIKDLFQ